MMAKKLRTTGTGASDVTTAPSGTGPHIFFDQGNGIAVYKPQGIEGSDTIYTIARVEPKATGVTYTASVLGSGG